MLEIKLFGLGRACYSGRSLPGFPNQQFYTLFCFLLLNRHHPYRREQLAAVFWGEYPTGASRKYLRDALWRLRAALQAAGAPAEDYVSIGDDSVCFSRLASYWLDVEAFENLIGSYGDSPNSVLTSERAAQLAEAVDLYTGDLLEGVYEDWCLYDRERLRLLYLNGLGRLLAYHAAHGGYEQALNYGERILAHDNTRESVHRQMMQLYWLLGERAAALAQYKRCAQILRDTLDISPMEETRRLYNEMLRDGCNPTEWPLGYHNTVAAAPGSSLARDTLERLRRLSAMVDEARIELRGLEHLLKTAADSEQP